MPKDQNHDLSLRIRAVGVPSPRPCDLCRRKGVVCLVSLAISRRCADCADVGSACKRMSGHQELSAASAKRRRLALEVKRAAAEVANSAATLANSSASLAARELELAEAEDEEMELIRRDEQSRLKLEKEVEAESSSSSQADKSTDANVDPVVPSLSEPFAADLGGLQTNKLLASSFNLNAFVYNFPFQPPSSSGDRLSPIPCSS